MEKPTFTRHGDGRVTVDRFTQQIVVARELLEGANPELLRREGGHLLINCANGSARYIIVGVDERTITGSLVEAK